MPILPTLDDTGSAPAASSVIELRKQTAIRSHDCTRCGWEILPDSVYLRAFIRDIDTGETFIHKVHIDPPCPELEDYDAQR